MADCPVDRPQELDKLIALKRHARTFVKISHTWSLSKQKYPWLDAQELVQAPACDIWSAAIDVGHGLADHREFGGDLRAGADAGARRHAIPEWEDKQWMLSKTISQVWPFQGVPR